MVDLNNVPGFTSLKAADQAKIRQAIARKHVDLSDVPESAKIPVPPGSVRSVTSRKRKPSSVLEPSSSQTAGPSSSQTTTIHRSSGPMPSDVIELTDEDEDEPGQETRDELYCVMKTQVVGLQYYTGVTSNSISRGKD